METTRILSGSPSLFKLFKLFKLRECLLDVNINSIEAPIQYIFPIINISYIFFYYSTIYIYIYI